MRFLLLLVAAVIAVFAGVAALQLGKGAGSGINAPAQATASQSVSTVDVLVARAPIAAGTVITAAMFDKQPWPENLVLDGFIVSGSPNANIIGKVTRSPFQGREPLITSKLASTTDAGFLAATLPTGMRAITIATDAITGVAGYVFPGDRVDILFTHNIPADIRGMTSASAPTGGDPRMGSSEKPGFSEVLISNVPVLAVNIRDAGNASDANVGGVASTAVNAMASATSSSSPSSLTLQVSDIQAEKLRLAEKVGALSVSLRSINDKENAAVTQPTALPSLTQIGLASGTPEVTQIQPAEDDTVRIIRGTDSSPELAGRKQ